MAFVCAGAAFAQTNVGISVEPDTLNFLQVKGGKFAIASFVIRNTMDSGRVSGSVNTPGGVFQIENGGGSFDLGPGEIQVVSLRFTPSATRLFSDSLAITHSMTGVPSPIYVHLRGSGSDSVMVGTDDSISISVTPTSLQFGHVRLGATAHRQVTIMNNSDSAMLVGSIGLGVTGSPFMIASGSGPFVLNAGESRVVTIGFSPTVAGEANGTLLVSYNSTDSSGVTMISLQGTGFQAGGGNGRDSIRLAFRPQMINFGSVRVGQTSQRSISIMNMSDSASISGTAALGVMAGTPFTILGTGGTFDLSAGGSQSLNLQFAPTTPGIFNNSVVVAYMVNGSIQLDTIRVMGIAIDSVRGGISGRIRTEPGKIDFGGIQVGRSYQRSITLRNEGETALTGTIANPAEPFFITSGAGSFTLMPGETRAILLNYSPIVAGSFTDNLLVNYASGDSTGFTLVELTGTAAAVQSSVNDREADALAAGYRLDQNRPNPFTGSTVIDFTLPKPGNVMLRVFNSRGETVATLLDNDFDAGAHQVVWEADGMESGVYLYQLQSGDITVAKRLTLTK
jgi:hypothetical protein